MPENVALKAVGLGRSSIASTATVLEGAVPIPQREIVEIGTFRAVGWGDLIVGLAQRSEIPDRAVRETDTKPCFGRYHRIEIGSRIVEVVPVRERCLEQPDAVFQLLRIGFGQDYDVGRATCPHPVPQTVVARIIMPDSSHQRQG